MPRPNAKLLSVGYKPRQKRSDETVEDYIKSEIASLAEHVERRLNELDARIKKLENPIP